jgi:hypothetical protein
MFAIFFFEPFYQHGKQGEQCNELKAVTLSVEFLLQFHQENKIIAKYFQLSHARLTHLLRDDPVHICTDCGIALTVLFNLLGSP